MFLKILVMNHFSILVSKYTWVYLNFTTVCKSLNGIFKKRFLLLLVLKYKKFYNNPVCFNFESTTKIIKMK